MFVCSSTVSHDSSRLPHPTPQHQNHNSQPENQPENHPEAQLDEQLNATGGLCCTEESEDFAGSGGTQSPGSFLKPETYVVTEEQVYSESHGIYAGLLMVEAKCAEICKHYGDRQVEISPFQWQPLISLFRTLLQEHHDFHLASGHPAASPAVLELAEKLEMPRRMWYIGIFGLLELQRRRLPESLEHMLTFVYETYYMLTLFLETVPRFEQVWMECLGDLARCRMRLEQSDLGEYELWAGIARYWYNKAADKDPDQGRIQHHLAVLAQPDVVQQLFYYTKSLTSVHAFARARGSFLPLAGSRPNQDPVAIALVSAHGQLFTQGVTNGSIISARHFLSNLEQHIGRMGAAFRLQGVYIMSSNFAAAFGYGHADAILPAEFSQPTEPANLSICPSASERGAPASGLEKIESDLLASRNSLHHSHLVFSSFLTFQTFSVALDQIGNKNVYPTIHVTLAFIWRLAVYRDTIKYIEAFVPWSNTAGFLNTMIRDDTDVSVFKSEHFPISEDRKHVPEDFCIRGQLWSRNYYPPDFFNKHPEEDDGRWIEAPSLSVSRAYRCLWLGAQIAQVR